MTAIQFDIKLLRHVTCVYIFIISAKEIMFRDNFSLLSVSNITKSVMSILKKERQKQKSGGDWNGK